MVAIAPHPAADHLASDLCKELLSCCRSGVVLGKARDGRMLKQAATPTRSQTDAHMQANVWRLVCVGGE